jgi:hypothetical protein
LQKREQNKTAWQNEAFGKALELLMRRQRQKVEIAMRSGVDGARKRSGHERHIGIHETKPLRLAKHRARPVPTGVRFSDPACRQWRAPQEFNLFMARRHSADDSGGGVLRMIVDDENAQPARRVILRDQRRQTSPDIVFFVTCWNDDRDRRRQFWRRR